ncbi:thioredoxin domain-containing protein [Ideonella sp. A 288]|uniref:DsbA family protein n=1 Tax=Ideonella sp. A 288 TaxID=1962181 RepID=UPI000B4A840C|nr:thioredoxin domain-containing protein [Ideonella sp. A 288]
MNRDDPVAETQPALAAADHSLGDPHATVTLLEYGDYECPFCIRAEPPTQRLIEASGTRLRFVFRHLPLTELHPHAELAAEATEAAAAQGRFWEMHRLLFAQTHPLDLPALTGHAASIGLDTIRFGAEMADRIYTQRIQEHRRAAALGGVKTTPTFILNGKVIDVSSGFDTLERAVAAKLSGR